MTVTTAVPGPTAVTLTFPAASTVAFATASALELTAYTSSLPAVKPEATALVCSTAPATPVKDVLFTVNVPFAGTGVGLGDKLGVGLGVGVAVCVGSGVGVGASVGPGVGASVGPGVGASVG